MVMVLSGRSGMHPRARGLVARDCYVIAGLSLGPTRSICIIEEIGAPERSRTPNPQIRSLWQPSSPEVSNPSHLPDKPLI
jgi:hypothetical protein